MRLAIAVCCFLLSSGLSPAPTVLAATASVAAQPSATTPAEREPARWRDFSDPEADISACYPDGWTVLVAEPRPDSLAAWSSAILEPGEVYKVTFLQGDDAFWPGKYELRILANPDSLDLDGFYSQIDLTDLWDDTAGDTAIAGRAAKTWVRWNYDSLLREYLFMNSVGAVHVRHDESNGNDRDFAAHSAIYSHMTGTLGRAQKARADAIDCGAPSE
jgi:hypothetical protein